MPHFPQLCPDTPASSLTVSGWGLRSRLAFCLFASSSSKRKLQQPWNSKLQPLASNPHPLMRLWVSFWAGMPIPSPSWLAAPFWGFPPAQYPLPHTPQVLIVTPFWSFYPTGLWAPWGPRKDSLFEDSHAKNRHRLREQTYGHQGELGWTGIWRLIYMHFYV